MLKIYNAYADHGKIKVEDFIQFDNGVFKTSHDYGFGDVTIPSKSSEKVNYDLTRLRDFRYGVNNWVTIKDGWVENFRIKYPTNYEDLKELSRNIAQTEESYQENGLTEEAILLFTDFISVTYVNNELIERVFGRYPGYAGLYLLQPNASIKMNIANHDFTDSQTYEVLQSQSLGKQLILSYMKRK